jgi:hypothetical protein
VHNPGAEGKRCQLRSLGLQRLHARSCLPGDLQGAVPADPEHDPFLAIIKDPGHLAPLKVTGVVAEVTTLELVVDGVRLLVSLARKRRKQYTNRPATGAHF